MDEIRAFAAKNESMESLLSRLISAVEKGDANPAARLEVVKEIRAIVDEAKALEVKTAQTYELTIWNEETLFQDMEAGKYIRRFTQEFETEQAFIKWVESEVKNGESFSFIVAR